MLRWYFAHVRGDLHLRILRMFEDTLLEENKQKKKKKKKDLTDRLEHMLMFILEPRH